MADYNLALRKRPAYGVPYNNRGVIHARRGALQSAIDDFSLSIKYTPKFLLAWTNRARARTLLKDFDGAIADFAEAEKIDAAAPQIAGNRCVTYGMMGKFDRALADCNGLIEKQPRNAFAINNRADVNMMKGDLDAALKDYNTVIQINPNNVRAHSGRGQIYERRKDLAQARADYRAAAYSLTRFDETEVARARAIAQERLAALTPKEAASATTGRRVALVVGNGAYKNVHALPNPPRDSKLIAGVLRDLGFQTVMDTRDLTRDAFFQTLKAFAEEAEKADWAMVYYAGHGFEIGGGELSRSGRRQAHRRQGRRDRGRRARAGDRRGRRGAKSAPRGPRCLPRQSVRAGHAAHAVAEAGREGLFQHRARCGLHGGLRRQARPDRDGWRW
ncbi:tetratricopeptide (TPR) repeat protein [Bradyrhizobium yuanmingense]